jgi:hypothetical protein
MNMNSEERRLKRRQLIYYLEICDDETGESIGHLVDLTITGVKIISREKIEKDKDCRLRISLPPGYFKEKQLVVDARSMWSSEDINTDYLCTGFQFTIVEPSASKIIYGLISVLGFND